MSIILPYDERLENHSCAFITPYGDTLLVEGKHEPFAKTYCLGPDYDYLTGAKIGPIQSKIVFSLAKEEYEKQIHSVDIFSTSKLCVNDLEKLKMWLDNHNGQNTYSDFLVYALSFDKVERKVNKLITSTAGDQHIRFFNYLLMGWRIENPEETVLLHANSPEFEFQQKNYNFRSNEDVDAEQEIIEITSRVPLVKRPFYFK